jgi:hypothetical protein
MKEKECAHLWKPLGRFEVYKLCGRVFYSKKKCLLCGKVVIESSN